MLIRDAQATDHQAIGALNDAAFGGPYESRLIDDLRVDGLAVIELVAVEDERPVGHLLLSRLFVEMDGRTLRALALAPMAVVPTRQRDGIGSALVREGLRLARERHWQAVIVLGYPSFYPRFGFSSALAERLVAPFRGEAFMALELEPGALAGAAGRVVYPPAFGVAG